MGLEYYADIATFSINPPALAVSIGQFQTGHVWGILFRHSRMTWMPPPKFIEIRPTIHL